MIRAVIFDFNGVLVDDEPVHCALLRSVLAEEGITLSEREYYEEYLGYDDRGCFETALARAGQSADRARIDALIARKAARYRTEAESGLKLFPGAAESVRAMAAHWPVAICSGALRGEIAFALERLGVQASIAAIIAAEDTARCKPDPEGYLLALEALRQLGTHDLAGLRPEHCLVIEDSFAGVASAIAAGMRPVAVSHTYEAHELRGAGAEAVVDSLAMLTPAWVEQTLGDDHG